MAEKGFSQIFVDRIEENVIAVTRNNPWTCERLILVAYSAFNNVEIHPNTQTFIKSMILEGQLEEIIMEAKLDDDSLATTTTTRTFQKDPKYINGDGKYRLIMNTNVPIEESCYLRMVNTSNPVEDTDDDPSSKKSKKMLEIQLQNFQPGCVVLFK